MPTPRTLPDRVLTDAERARRARDAKAAYIAALERATTALSKAVNDQHPVYRAHYDTIARARAAQTATKED